MKGLAGADGDGEPRLGTLRCLHRGIVIGGRGLRSLQGCLGALDVDLFGELSRLGDDVDLASTGE